MARGPPCSYDSLLAVQKRTRPEKGSASAALSDWRESPSIEVLRQLSRQGVTVFYADPFVPSLELDGALLSAVPLDGLAAYNAVVILTPHADFDLEATTPRRRRLPGMRPARH